jgi:hypothetical protein
LADELVSRNLKKASPLRCVKYAFFGIALSVILYLLAGAADGRRDGLALLEARSLDIAGRWQPPPRLACFLRPSRFPFQTLPRSLFMSVRVETSLSFSRQAI